LVLFWINSLAQQEKDRLDEQIDYLNSHISPEQVELKKNEILEIGNQSM
jgi:hypothetical protein